MARVALSILVVLAIMYVVAFLVYGGFAAAFGIEAPTGGSPALFLLSVLGVKIGLATVFVLLFYFARGTWTKRWILYAFVWWLMYVIGEAGQAIGPGYSWIEAGAGIAAETIYCPACAFVTAKLLGGDAEAQTRKEVEQ